MSIYPAALQPPPRAGWPGRGLALLRRIELWIVGITLCLIVGCVLWGIATRYLSPSPSPWTIEVAAIAFCWCCLIGSGALYATGIHPRVFEPSQLASAALRRFATSVSLVAEIAVLGAVGYFGAIESITHLDNPTSVLRLPVTLYYLPLVWFSASSLIAVVTRR